MVVVKNGDNARYLIHMDNYDEWTDADTRGYVRTLALTVRLFYGDKIRQRVDAVIEVARGLKKEGLDPKDNMYEFKQRAAIAWRKVGWLEKLMLNQWFRALLFKNYGPLLAFFALYYYLGLS
jgi:hypothetical protein